MRVQAKRRGRNCAGQHFTTHSVTPAPTTAADRRQRAVLQNHVIVDGGGLIIALMRGLTIVPTRCTCLSIPWRFRIALDYLFMQRIVLDVNGCQIGAGGSSFSNIACGAGVCRKNLAGALESTRAGDMLSGLRAQAYQGLRR